MNYPLLPFYEDQYPEEWFRSPESDFGRTLRCALYLIDNNPDLVTRVKLDLDHAALVKKEARRSDQAAAYNEHPILPNLLVTDLPPAEQVLNLETGRPRMKPEICLLFVVLRGYLGGIKSRAARDFLAESTTLRRYLAQRGNAIPSLTTILENVNHVSQETLDAALDAQIHMVKEQGLDSFENITGDSTACRANTRWPTDSGLICFLASRLWRTYNKITKFGIGEMIAAKIPETLDELDKLNFGIAMATGRKNAADLRKTGYRDFLDEAEVLDQVFTEAWAKIDPGSLALKPSRQQNLEKLVREGREDLALLNQLIINANTRVLDEDMVPKEDKVPSVTDPSTAFITKGQRETVVGYRPQIAKSSGGFVTALIVPEGNMADATQVLPLYQATVARTQVVPKVTSWDDGYTSKTNRESLLREGVETVSFSGSKGKKITPLEQWESESYGEARRMRSAVESVIYQLKQGFGLDDIMRRTVEKVRAEMTWKVLAFNFYRFQYLLA